ncbi:MAG: ABC transporter permease [Thermoplasmatota archaeon]|nr:ABC transporter permease [Candidatus Thermoplasmatota archaeon]MBU1915237.1 ABC transporter permease [Candidatus Thermoplasmatota archaeon]
MTSKQTSGTTKKGATAPAKAAKAKSKKGGVVDDLKMALKPHIREWKFDLHLMSKSLTSIVGMVLLVILVMLAAAPFLFMPPQGQGDPFEIPIDLTKRDPLPPGTPGYPLGSMVDGRSVLYGIVWGARTSMAFAIQVVLVGAAIGLVLGLVSGYKGGILDELVMRFTDIFLSIPGLILVMAIAAVLGRNLNATKLALMAVWWSGYTRLIRGQVLSVRENTYIDAARASGSGELKIMFRHVLPNSWAPMVVAATMDMGTVVLVMAGLSYLGLGAPHGYAEWGMMINDGQQRFVYGDWWMIVFPGLAILMFVLAFNLMGDGLRDVLDPKMRR